MIAGHGISNGESAEQDGTSKYPGYNVSLSCLTDFNGSMCHVAQLWKYSET